MKIGFVILVWMLTLSAAFAQAPDAPTPRHSFTDRTNLALLGATAGALAMDGYVTRDGLSQGFRCHCHESNPIARPFVQSDSGAALYFAGSFIAEVGAMRLAHVLGHHKIERMIPVIVGGMEVKAVRSWY
jgi:hypothetical protein